MLVLSRKKEESILIGNYGEVKIKVLRIEGDQVRIGVEAPREIDVHRQEIFERIHEEEQKKSKKEKEVGVA